MNQRARSRKRTGMGNFREGTMGNLVIVYWRDIPAQVIVEGGGQTARKQLAQRFQDGIDQAAMISKAHESDAYMAEWRRADPVSCGDDAEAEAAAAVERLESEFNLKRLLGLVEAGGRVEP